jgi:hypothetical protein
MFNPLRSLFQKEEIPLKEGRQEPGRDDLLDFDPATEVGVRKITYEAVNPYQEPAEIPIPKYPEITTVRKADNTLYKEERGKRVNAVFDAVRPYYDFMIAYEALSANPKIAFEIQRVIRNFIITFWDMPASRNDHHTGRFGLLTHSLQTACESAAAVAANNVCDQYGMDSERSYKERAWLLFGYFLIGLLHDANKIFDYRIRARREPGGMEVEFRPLSGSMLNFKMTFPSELTTCTWENFENQDFVLIPHFFFFFIPWKVQLAMPHYIYVDVLSRLSQKNEDEAKKLSDIKSIMTEMSDPKIKKSFFSAMRKTLIACFDNLDDLHAAPIIRIDENWYIVDNYSFFALLTRYMNKSAEYIMRLMYNAKLLGGMATGLNKPVCSAKFNIFYDAAQQNSGFIKELSFIKAEAVEPILKEIYLIKNVKVASGADMTDLPGIRPAGVLIHPHYYALAQLFCEERMRLSEHVFGTPEGVGGQSPPEEAAVSPEQGDSAAAEVDNTSEKVDDDPDDPFSDEPLPRVKKAPVKRVVLGGQKTDSDVSAHAGPLPQEGIPDKAPAENAILPDDGNVGDEPAFDDDMPPAEESTEERSPAEYPIRSLTKTLESVVSQEKAGSRPAAHASEQTSEDSIKQDDIPAESTQAFDDDKASIEEAAGEPSPAAGTSDRDSPGPAEGSARSIASSQPSAVASREEVDCRLGAHTQGQPKEDEPYLTEDGMPTRTLARALMPLFVKNYLLLTLPSQVGSEDCAVFIARNKSMYIARDKAFKYLYQFAVADGLLPCNVRSDAAVYAKLADYWVDLNYLNKKLSSATETTYTNVSLYDAVNSQWITSSIIFAMPYLVNYTQMSNDVNIGRFQHNDLPPDKTFGELILKIHHMRYSTDTVQVQAQFNN